MKTTEKLNKIYSEYKQYFETDVLKSSIHNLLWQIMINKAYQGKNIAFHPNISNEGTEMVIADEQGCFYHTHLFFLDSDYNKCCDISEKLSIEVFDYIDGNGSYEHIITKSMFN
jgi:hypothetical protein